MLTTLKSGYEREERLDTSLMGKETTGKFLKMGEI